MNHYWKIPRSGYLFEQCELGRVVARREQLQQASQGDLYDGRKVTTYRTHQWYFVLEVFCVGGILCWRYFVLEVFCVGGILCWRYFVLEVFCVVYVGKPPTPLVCRVCSHLSTIVDLPSPFIPQIVVNRGHV